MKKLLLFINLCLIASSLNFVNAQNLDAYLSYSTFMSPKDGPYVETYLSVFASTVKFLKNADNKFQGNLEVTMIFKQNDKVITFKKINLKDIVDDTNNIDLNFLDQQRFVLANGTYDFETKIADLNNNTPPFKSIEKVIVDFSSDKINVSDIELIKSFEKTTEQNVLSKAGYDLMPYVFNYFPEKIDKLIFYAEIYNADKEIEKDGKYLISFFIESFETRNILKDLVKYKKETANKVNVVFNEFDISKLPSGNYNLAVEVRNRENKLLSSKRLFFQRSNPNVQLDYKDIETIDLQNTFVLLLRDIDTLTNYIYSLTPISSKIEIIFAQNQIKKGDISMMQKYFLNFWITRNSLNPEQAWNDYFIEVQKVNKDFGTQIKNGYETDRGRVYLQYGPPNTIAERHREPSCYPYEIWHYYNIGNQSNKKFVFYNRDLVTNDFELLHSNAIGEVNNYSWQLTISKRDTETHSIDDSKGTDHWGGKANEYYNNPR